jgi:hypothetical protein
VHRDGEEVHEAGELLGGGAVHPDLARSDRTDGEAVPAQQGQQAARLGREDPDRTILPGTRPHRSRRTNEAAANPHTIATHSATQAR